MDIASLVVKLSDEVKVRYKEEHLYTTCEFIANLGGTAGVVLGIDRKWN